MSTTKTIRNGVILAVLAVTASLPLAGTATAAGPPAVVTEHAREVTRSSMKLCGTVDPNGESTTYRFVYEHYESGSWRVEETATRSAGEGEAAIEECATIIGLGYEKAYGYELVAVNASGEARGTPEIFTQTQGAVEGLSILAATNVEAHSMTVRGTFEPNGYDTHYYFECAVANGYIVVHPTSYSPEPPGGDAGSASGSAEVEAQFDGLGANTAYSCYLIGANALGTTKSGELHVVTQPAAPEVDVPHPSAGQVTARTAAIHGAIATQNETTRYWVQYVDEADYDGAAEDPYADGATSAVGELSAEAAVSTSVASGLSGLSPQTVYHFRLVAENGTGTTYGPDYTFTTGAPTPPIVTTAPASGVSATGATLLGTVDARGLKTSYEFEIGNSTSYGGAEIFGNGGEGQTTEAVSTTLAYLAPGTTYHYRLVATNIDGTSYGPDQAFTTSPVSSPIVQPPSTPLLSFAPIAFPSVQGVSKAVVKQKTKRKAKKKTSKRHNKHAAKHKKK